MGFEIGFFVSRNYVSAKKNNLHTLPLKNLAELIKTKIWGHRAPSITKHVLTINFNKRREKHVK